MAVAQLVESRIVIPVVVGSSPISHPKEYVAKTNGYALMPVAIFFTTPPLLTQRRLYATCTRSDRRAPAILPLSSRRQIMYGARQQIDPHSLPGTAAVYKFNSLHARLYRCHCAGAGAARRWDYAN